MFPRLVGNEELPATRQRARRTWDTPVPETTERKMGLLDGIENAQGFAAANYLRGGRTLVEITRVSFTEADGVKSTKTTFRVDGRVLHSTNPTENPVGVTKTVNVGFKFPDSARPNMVRILMALLSSKEGGRLVKQSEINKAKVLELTGEDQPLIGTVIAFDAVEDRKASRVSPKNPDGVFTKYEASVPGDADVRNLEIAA